MKQRIAPQTGTSFRLQKGDLLWVCDVHGQQVADLYCINAHDPKDTLSSGRSIDYAETIFFTKGHQIYAYSGQVMMTIIEDTCGRHDFLVTPCSCQMFQMISGQSDWHPSCQENLEKSLANFDIAPHQIGTTFNLFMNVDVSPTGKVKVLPPKSRAGDSVVLRAEMDLIVGLTACSDEGTNNGSCKPIEYEIRKPAGEQSRC